MTSAQIIIVVTIVLYLAAMVFVGVYFGKKGSGSSSDDFYLGGRKMGPVVTAMSAEASDMSSYLLMGLPGLAYLCGLPEVTWTAIGLAIGTYLNWLIVARRLRRYSAKLGAITIPDFFARRFGDKKHLLSCIAAVVILIFFIPYTASGFKAIGTLFNSLFGVEYHTAMIVGGIVVVLYTVMGGFMAVSFTDLIQSIFMTIALIVIVCFGVQQAGGLDTVIDNARALPGYLNMTQGYDAATGTASTYSALSIVSTLAWGLGYFGMPHILLRFMAIREEKELNQSRRIATIWVVISMFIAVCIGVIGYSVSAAGKVPFLATSAESETIIIKLADLMSQPRRAARRHGGHHPLGHSGRNDVDRGLAALGRGVQRVTGPHAALVRHEDEPAHDDAGRARHGHRHRPYRHGACVGPQQLRVPRGFVCVGGLWRGVRPRDALLALLEAREQAGRARGHDHWRRGGLHLEVPHRADGRRVGHLRAAPRVPCGVHCDRDRIARDARAGEGRHRYLRRDLRQIKGKNRRGLRPSLFFVSQME